MSKKNDGPHWVDVYVGNTIRTTRRRLGISQTALGNEVGLTFQQIQKYEKGTNRVSCSMLWEIARALHVGPAQLLPHQSEEKPQYPFVKLPAEDVKIILAQITGLAKQAQRSLRAIA